MTARRTRGRGPTRSARRADIHGLLLVDKPSGPTSFDVVRDVRRATRARKVGHAGTLDPLASGLLLVCLGEGTKAVPWLMDAPKEYVATVVPGVETDTLDAAGEVTAERPVPPLDRAAVEAVLDRFRGTIEQVPPSYSALKQDGERLYEKARRGEAVSAPPRPVTVHDIAVEDVVPAGAPRADGDGVGAPAARPRIVLRVCCGKGFYVRSLARDLGDALGCGAHLAALRRTATAGFVVADATLPDALLADEAWRARLLPVADALGHLPAVTVDADDARRIGHGNPVPWSRSEPPPDGPIRLLAPDGRLLAVGRVDARDGQRIVTILRGFRLPDVDIAGSDG